MFPHCLLSALLLLAAIDFCTALRSTLVKTEAIAGTTGSEPGRKEKFYIPDRQCYGILIVHKQKPLVCPPGSGIEGLVVTVYDKLPVNITISEISGHSIDHVKIVRQSCSGKAIVYAAVNCEED